MEENQNCCMSYYLYSSGKIGLIPKPQNEAMLEPLATSTTIWGGAGSGRILPQATGNSSHSLWPL